MAPRLDPVIIQRIEDELRTFITKPSSTIINQIASDYGTTSRTINRHYNRIQRGLAPGKRSGGQRKVITLEVEAAIEQLLDYQPWLYQDEIQDFLVDAFDIHISRSNISRVLKNINFTRKRLKVAAAQRDDILRTDWLDELQFYTAEQFVFVDESGSDDRTGDRRYGYAAQGARATVSRLLGRSERISVLPAYTLDGYIASITFPGTCTGEIFAE